MRTTPKTPWSGPALLAVLLAFAASAASTNSAWVARTWQSDDGLPNDNVNALAQTSDGYLWIATSLGLARFDGLHFEQMASSNFIAEPNRGVMALTRSRAGGLWLQMDRGAVVGLNAEKVTVHTPADNLPDYPALSLLEEDDGTLWITHIGGAIYSLKNGKGTPLNSLLGLPPGPNSSVARDTHGRIWAARGGRVGVVEDGRFQQRLLSTNLTERIAAARGGGIWICSGPRLSRLGEDGVLREIGEFPVERPGVESSVLLEDRNGVVWMGSAFDGLFSYDGSRFENIPLPHAEISAVIEDREGNIWVGTRGGGVSRLRPREVTLEGPESGLPTEAVQSLCEAANGDIWATTATGQLVRRRDSRWSVMTEGWTGGMACSVVADPDGAVWIGTRNRLLARWRNRAFEYWGGTDGVEATPVPALVLGDHGELWLGGHNRFVQRFRDGQFLTIKLADDARVIRAATRDALGNVWFGTSKGVLLRVSGDAVVNETGRISPDFHSIRCLDSTPDGSVWIGFAGWGLGRLKDGCFTRITSESGLYDDYISQIIADDRGWLWLGADHGIFKVRLREFEAVTGGQAARVRSIHYGRGDGLPSLQAQIGYSPGSLRSRDGRLWIPTRSGLAVVDPERLEENVEAPPVRVRRVVMDEKTVAAYNGVGPVRMGISLAKTPNALRLPPGHRKLEFEFTALSFSAVENVRFQHRLDGFDESWIEGTQRSASYPRLPAGDYRFRVKACNSDGVWNEAGAAVVFTVAPFVWQTWWFRLLSAGIFFALMIVAVRYVSFRQLRRRVHALEQQAALDKERARIARDLHDDLGSRLTKIVLLSDLVPDYRSEPDKSARTAQEISSSVRQLIKALDETVWAVNPRNDTLPHLIDYIGQFAVEFLRAAGIRCRVDLPERPPAVPVTAEVRHNLFLTMKEALNNVVRHASATEVSLSVTANNGSVCLTIADNGQGFVPTPDDPGADGLRNMRQRMEEIGGQFQLDARPAAGTRVSLIAPLSHE